jgi:hypothetical protein
VVGASDGGGAAGVPVTLGEAGGGLASVVERGASTVRACRDLASGIHARTRQDPGERACRDPRHLPSAARWRRASWARSASGFHARTRRGGAEAVWGGGPGSAAPSIGGKRTFHPRATGRTVHHSNVWTPTLHS